MDFSNLVLGFTAILTVPNLVASLAGVMLGNLAGVLPGLGISGTVAVLLPVSYGMEPLTALILISGVFAGASYGGAITSILVNIPGEATSIVTTFDGHPLAKAGRAGLAIGTAATASFVGGTIGLIGLTFFAPVLSQAALAFGPPEYLAVTALGLVLLANISGGSRLHGYIMLIGGVLLGTVGLDAVFGTTRLTFGSTHLLDGINFIIVVMGVFGITELLLTLCTPGGDQPTGKFSLRGLFPARNQIRPVAAAMGRGGLIGFALGLIPGPSSTISTFASYEVEKKLSKDPDRFGKGALEGIASPEASNNSSFYSQLIPLLSLGIPFSASIALLMSAFIIHGIRPGPQLVVQQPVIFWGLIASLYLGNVILFVLNVPLAGMWASVLRIRFDMLMPVITIITFTGAYALNNSVFDLRVMVVFGVVGLIAKYANYDMTAFVVGLFLGPFFEKSLVQSMVMFDGNMGALLGSRPISTTLFIVMVIVIVAGVVRPLVPQKVKEIVE